MASPPQRPDAAVLLEAEHAVTRVLASGREPRRAYPRVVQALGEALGWSGGAVWEPDDDGEGLRCVATWNADWAGGVRARADGLVGRVYAGGRPARSPDRSTLCVPVRGAREVIGVIELRGGTPSVIDRALLATMASLGRQVGQYVERCRAQHALRVSDARKSAILDAALDCVITMDHSGRVVEVNRATERMFGYAARDMTGRELAELIIPPELRDAHRRGLARYVATGRHRVIGHPLELTGMRADGSRFPVEIAITRPRVQGRPLFTGYIRDVTERRRAEQELRSLVAEQAALRRVATAVAAADDPRGVFSLVTEEVGRLLGAHTANMIRYDEWPSVTVVGGWGAEGFPSFPVGETFRLEGETLAVKIHRSGRPERMDSLEAIGGELRERVRAMGLRAAVGAPIHLGGRLWGAVMVQTIDPEPFPTGAEDRVGSFAELAAQALANAEARAELAASRARIVEAADAARRRLERNLHDGAQQRLVALALTLRLAERRLPADPDGARALLAAAQDELGRALDELREIARGIHPAILSDRGLAPALAALAARAPVPVEVDARLDTRLPEPIEAAAYYVVAEALTNVARYARATAVAVTVRPENGRLDVTVADNGVGGAEEGTGSGLRGLADRVEALGGHLEVTSPPGVGTTLRARIPLATR